MCNSINPSDLLYVRGKYAQLAKLPATPGFEGMGVIEASGGGMLCWLRGLKPGRRVAVVSPEGGTWQESIVVSARTVIPLPDDIPDEQGASFFVNPVTAVVLLQHVLKIHDGDALLQTAAGSALGRMIIRLANSMGCKVINVVRRREQAAELRQLGAWEVISSDVEDVVKRVEEITAGRGVAWAIDAVGGLTGAAALRSLAPGCKLVVYGTLSGEPIPVEPRELIGPRSPGALHGADRKQPRPNHRPHAIVPGGHVQPVERDHEDAGDHIDNALADDGDRRHLWHELRAHARDEMGPGLSLGPLADGAGRGHPAALFSLEEVAVTSVVDSLRESMAPGNGCNNLPASVHSRSEWTTLLAGKLRVHSVRGP